MKPKDALNKDIVLFALYQLGGATGPVHTEDIANRVFQYPVGRQRYSWDRYDAYPDKERVARELRRLKGQKGTPFVKGHVNVGAKKDRLDGWMLTPAGVDHVKSLEHALATVLTTSMGAYSVYKVGDLRRRILDSDCYKIYEKNRALTEAEDNDLTDMLYCLPDAPKEKIRTEFDQLLASAKAVEEREIIKFLESVGKRFARLLVE